MSTEDYPYGLDKKDIAAVGGKVLTGRDISLDLAKLDVAFSTRASETTLGSVLTQLDITLSALRDAVCAASPNNKTLADLFSRLAETLTRNITTWGGIALTGRDITSDLAKLDITISALRDALKGVSNKDLTTLEADIESILAKLDVALSTRATETTLALIKGRLAFLEFDDNFVKPDWDDDNTGGDIYSPEITSGAIDTYSDVWSKLFPPSEIAGTLEKMARGETAKFTQLNTTTTLTWQWQIRPKNGTWINLHAETTEAANTITGGKEITMQGEKIPSGLTTTPFEIKLRFKTSEANQGQAKVKASSYVKYRLRVT